MHKRSMPINFPPVADAANDNLLQLPCPRGKPRGSDTDASRFFNFLQPDGNGFFSSARIALEIRTCICGCKPASSLRASRAISICNSRLDAQFLHHLSKRLRGWWRRPSSSSVSAMSEEMSSSFSIRSSTASRWRGFNDLNAVTKTSAVASVELTDELSQEMMRVSSVASSYSDVSFSTQRREGAKSPRKTQNKIILRLCVFAPLR